MNVESLNFLVAISTFFSIAHLTCAIAYPKLCTLKLYFYFHGWYLLMSLLIVLFLWDFYGLEINLVIKSAIPFWVFLLFVTVFSNSLATRLTKELDAVKKSD